MTTEAILPCFICGKRLLNACADAENQPREATEFRTYGHYGSTLWDNGCAGEELVLNICDECLRQRTDRLAQHKRFLPVMVDALGAVGRHWVDRPMVPYTGNIDDTVVKIEPAEIGTDLPRTDWRADVAGLRDHALKTD